MKMENITHFMHTVIFLLDKNRVQKMSKISKHNIISKQCCKYNILKEAQKCISLRQSASKSFSGTYQESQS